MNEALDNTQHILNNSVSNVEKNRQNYWASYYKKKLIICYLLLIIFIVISLLTLIDYIITELPPSDYSIKAIYFYSDSIDNYLYNNFSGVNILKMWINGKSVPTNTTYCDVKSGCEVYYKIDLSGCTSLRGMFKYNENLEYISFSSRFNTKNIKDMSYLFSDCHYLRSIDISHFDTSNVKNMNRMFYYCYLLNSLDISNFNTENVTDMSEMFYNIGIKSLDLSNFNTKNIVTMKGMFKESDLRSIDISHFDTTKVKYMDEMFSSCKDLKSINLASFNTGNTIKMNNMFQGCKNLTSINLSNFNTKNVTHMSGMFFSCSKLLFINISSFTITDINNNFNLSSGLPENGTLIIKSEYKDKIISIPSSWTIEPVE